jgi:hypothetical protein
VPPIPLDLSGFAEAARAWKDPAWNDGKCVRCGKERTPEGHDPCIANLPGVRNACCGHGIGPGYISFEDGRIISMEITEIEYPGPNYAVTRVSFHRPGS